MPRCVVCGKSVISYCLCENEKIPACFYHHKSGAFIDYLIVHYPDKSKQTESRGTSDCQGKS